MLEEYLDLLKVKIIIKKYSYLFVIIEILVPRTLISNCFIIYNFLNSPTLLLHQVVLLNGTYMFANGSEFKMLNDDTSQSAKRRRPMPRTRYITVHDGHKMDLFLE
jgi:hypothetical protein